MAPVSLARLRKSYGSRTIFDDFNLDIADGELLCLLGPSGSGKTTLIRLIAGLERLEGGEIRIGGKDVSFAEPRERHVGMTFQGYALYPHLSVRQNLLYPLKVRGVPKAEADRRVTEAARLLGIAQLLERRVQQISGGEQQRVAIGRAIVQKPQLYLLDEPISNLDASLRESVRSDIRRLQQALAATMVIVTHDQLDALAIADRIAVLRHGVLQQLGSPEELYEKPDNVFVAGFIGRMRMNFLPGRLLRESGVVLQGAGFSLALPGRFAPLLDSESREVTLGVRPDALLPCAGPAPDAIAVVVKSIQFQGEQVLCSALAGEATIQAALADGHGLLPGAPAWLRPRADKLHLFDTESGLRLSPPALHAGFTTGYARDLAAPTTEGGQT